MTNEDEVLGFIKKSYDTSTLFPESKLSQAIHAEEKNSVMVIK